MSVTNLYPTPANRNIRPHRPYRPRQSPLLCLRHQPVRADIDRVLASAWRQGLRTPQGDWSLGVFDAVRESVWKLQHKRQTHSDWAVGLGARPLHWSQTRWHRAVASLAGRPRRLALARHDRRDAHGQWSRRAAHRGRTAGGGRATGDAGRRRARAPAGGQPMTIPNVYWPTMDASAAIIDLLPVGSP